jgi:DNA polymerase-1
MKRAVLDIETDGLNPKVIFCVVLKDIDTGEVHTYTEDNMSQLKEVVDGLDLIVGHNVLCFDLPCVRRLLGIHVGIQRVCDTLVQSRMFNPVREGGHSLENWGKVLKFPKGNYEDFSQFTPEMLAYCKQDVELTYRVWCYQGSEGKGFSKESIILEHQIAVLIHNQMKKGFKLDLPKAHSLYVETKSKAEKLQGEIVKDFPPVPKLVKEVTPRTTKDGSLSKVGLKLLGPDAVLVGGPFSLIDWQEFNLGSPKQVVARLNGHWEPRLFTETNQPKVCEENFETIKSTAPPSIKKLGEYLMLTSRYKTISQWIDAVDNNNRVHGTVFHIGTITHRMSHNNPNMGNITAVDKPYGKDMRACWTVEDPRKFSLVGTDASSIQLRILAHYMGDEDYIKEVVHGDIHERNRVLAGITTRSQAKTFIYAWLLGAGDSKVGSIIGGDSKAGREVKERFLKNLPALADLKERASVAAIRGYMIGLDGRRVAIKSDHYALSAYLQSGEAIVMKKAMVLYTKELHRLGLSNVTSQVMMVHDEYQDEVLSEHAETIGKTRIWSITEAGLQLKVKTPLAGEYKIGKNWCETH